MSRYDIEVFFKSGNSFRAWFKEVTVHHTTEEVTSIDYNLVKSGTDMPLFMDCSQIEAVIQHGFKS